MRRAVHLLGLAGAVFGCTGQAVPVAQAAAPITADIVLTGVAVRHYRDATLTLSATAPRLNMMHGTTDVTAENATVHLHTTGVDVTAATVRGNANEGRMEGHDGVTLQTRDGMTGRAPSGIYEKNRGAQGSAHGEVGMHAEHPDFILDAETFDIDFAEQRAAFTKPTTTTRAKP